MLEYLLGKVDHQDKDGVVLAYGLFQESRRENYGMRDILRLLERGGQNNEECRLEKPDEKRILKRSEEQSETGTAAAEGVPSVWEEGSQGERNYPGSRKTQNSREKLERAKSKTMFWGLWEAIRELWGKLIQLREVPGRKRQAEQEKIRFRFPGRICLVLRNMRIRRMTKTVRGF